ncbi:MAG: carboxymuconolactone decarboxylase family protein [Rudaea sp.]
MSRIPAIDPATATGRARQLLDAVRAQLGIAPNFTRVLAHSPQALEGFLGLYGATAGFAIDKATQERIALAVAEGNACPYCLSAHTAIGRAAGLTNDEMSRNRRGTSVDARPAAIVAFAKALNEGTGDVSATEFDAVRAAGVSDGEIVEIIALVALNLFTNVLNKAVQVNVDFPRVEPFAAAVPLAA